MRATYFALTKGILGGSGEGGGPGFTRTKTHIVVCKSSYPQHDNCHVIGAIEKMEQAHGKE